MAFGGPYERKRKDRERLSSVEVEIRMMEGSNYLKSTCSLKFDGEIGFKALNMIFENEVRCVLQLKGHNEGKLNN